MHCSYQQESSKSKSLAFYQDFVLEGEFSQRPLVLRVDHVCFSHFHLFLGNLKLLCVLRGLLGSEPAWK